MQYDADVIIAGAGPAGTIAAFELARQGVDVLILEKAEFPRYKVCGGGLTHKILQEIPFDVDSVIEREIFSIRFSCNFTDSFTLTATEPLIHCTMRDKLDQLLLRNAVEAGSRVMFGEHISGITQGHSGLDIKTRRGSWKSHYLIGADGASSVVAKASGLWKNIMPGMAWEAEMEAAPEDIKQLSQTVFLDWGTIPGSYGWIFPKQNHFSVGIGGPASLSEQLKPYGEKFIRLSGIRFMGPQTMKAWPIPVRTKKGLFHSGRILIAGDAAGLTDPMTGEGIYYAVKSGRHAAMAIYDQLQGDPNGLIRYTDEINNSLMPELMEAERIKAIFNAVPLFIHRKVKERDRVWRAFWKILRGERNYLDVKRGFGMWRFLWGTTCWVAKRYHFLRTGLRR